MNNGAGKTEDSLSVCRGRVDSITIYEVTESELAELEAGTPTGYLFDLFLALLAFAISFAVTLTTTEIKSNRLFSVYTVVSIGCAIGSLICLILWLVMRRRIKKTVKQIRSRVAPPTASASPDPTVKQ